MVRLKPDPTYLRTKSNPAHLYAPGQTEQRGGTIAASCRIEIDLLLRKHRVFELLRDTRLDDRLGRDLDGLARRGVAAHARLSFLHHQLHHAWQHELTGALELLLRQRRQL